MSLLPVTSVCLRLPCELMNGAFRLPPHRPTGATPWTPQESAHHTHTSNTQISRLRFIGFFPFWRADWIVEHVDAPNEIEEQEIEWFLAANAGNLPENDICTQKITCSMTLTGSRSFHRDRHNQLTSFSFLADSISFKYSWSLSTWILSLRRDT